MVSLAIWDRRVLRFKMQYLGRDFQGWENLVIMGMNKLNEAKLYLENDKWLSSFAAGLLRVTWLCLY